MITVRTVEGIATGSARADWELLLDEDPNATLFQGPRFLEVWKRVLGDAVEARTHLFSDEGRLVGVVAEAHERMSTMTGPQELRQFLGGNEVTDYLGPVARRHDRADVAAAYLDLLATDLDWDEFAFRGLAVDSTWPDLFETGVVERGWTLLDRGREDVCPHIDLSGGYDAYLGSLPSKQRHELKRRARKLARDAGEVRLVEVKEAHLHDRLDDFFEMAAGNESDKGGFFRRDVMRTFFHALADEFGPDAFRLHVLDVADRPGAFTISLVQGGHWGLYNSTFDPALRALGPGMVLVGDLIEIAAKEGCREFDLLRGDEPYKYRFGATDRELVRFTATRGSGA